MCLDIQTCGQISNGIKYNLAQHCVILQGHDRSHNPVQNPLHPVRLYDLISAGDAITGQLEVIM